MIYITEVVVHLVIAHIMFNIIHGNILYVYGKELFSASGGFRCYRLDCVSGC